MDKYHVNIPEENIPHLLEKFETYLKIARVRFENNDEEWFRENEEFVHDLRILLVLII
jgi:hypothetical protein